MISSKCWILALFFLGTIAQAAQPAQKPIEPHAQTPVAMRIVETPENAAERRANAVARNEGARVARFAAYTGIGLLLVAIGQLGLFVWQLRLMRKTIEDSSAAARAATAAANAAELNARAAIGIELPLITAEVLGLLRTNRPVDQEDPPGGAVNDGYPERFSALGPIIFRNSGRTPAILTRLELGWMAAERLPPEPVYQSTFVLEGFSILQPNGEFEAPYCAAVTLSDEEQAAVKNGAAWLWHYGVLHYTDFLGDDRQARFCFRYDRRPRGILNPFNFFNDGAPPAAYIRA